MQRTVKERKTLTINKGNYAHILIEQSNERVKYNMVSAYMGHTGFALKQIVKLTKL